MLILIIRSSARFSNNFLKMYIFPPSGSCLVHYVHQVSNNTAVSRTYCVFSHLFLTPIPRFLFPVSSCTGWMLIILGINFVCPYFACPLCICTLLSLIAVACFIFSNQTKDTFVNIGLVSAPCFFVGEPASTLLFILSRYCFMFNLWSNSWIVMGLYV